MFDLFLSNMFLLLTHMHIIRYFIFNITSPLWRQIKAEAGNKISLKNLELHRARDA